MGKQKWLLGLLAIVLIFILLYKLGTTDTERERIPQPAIEERGNRPGPGTLADIEERGNRPDPGTPADIHERGGLNRDARSLIYSKHARCRMGCRHISEEEVMAILKDGKINYSKSDLRGSPDPKYALEGPTNDGQQVRVIFANSPRGIVVVTVIDLENEWKCNCK